MSSADAGSTSVSPEEAMMGLFIALEGWDWTKRDGWESTCSANKFGVTTNSKDEVTMIVLTNNGLSGVIPDAIKHLCHLSKLSLNKNHIYGPICKGIGFLDKLVSLQLQDNNLTGRIPCFLKNLKLLQRLDISKNYLVGSIPDELFTLKELRWLHLDDNKLSGVISSEIENLSNLKYFSINGNVIEFNRDVLVSQLPGDCVIVADDNGSSCLLS